MWATARAGPASLTPSSNSPGLPQVEIMMALEEQFEITLDEAGASQTLADS